MLDRFPESYFQDSALFTEPEKFPEIAFTGSRGRQFFDGQFTDFLIRVAGKRANATVMEDLLRNPILN